MSSNTAYEMIICLVNEGFSDAVMDSARKEGVRGGTVIHAHGTANKEAEKIFKVTIQPEKDMVMMLVPAKIKDNVLHSLYRDVGLDSAGQGIAFSMPVSKAVGINTEDKDSLE